MSYLKVPTTSEENSQTMSHAAQHPLVKRLAAAEARPGGDPEH